LEFWHAVKKKGARTTGSVQRTPYGFSEKSGPVMIRREKGISSFEKAPDPMPACPILLGKFPSFNVLPIPAIKFAMVLTMTALHLALRKILIIG